VALSGAGLLAGASPSAGDLASRAQSLQQGISADNGRIQAYQGKLADLQQRLAEIQSSLTVQRDLLARYQTELIAARARLATLQGQLAADRQALAKELVSQYETPSPTVTTVVLESRGFTDLLERMDQLKTIASHNAGILRQVATAKTAVSKQAAQLALDEQRQRRVMTAVLIERDQVASVQLSMLQQESVVASSRASKQAELRNVQHKLAVLAAAAAAAQRRSFALDVPAGAGYTGGGFALHGGEFGFFPAPGTNYSVGQEPQIAARLDALGQALHLHLIGISGYRTPQHSVEVGGFANDPHTRGQASDTPGIEGVSEATLNRFGLTRPFAGAAEADPIQLA
jgi:peptidoglycan hydrolase CwlO-like protein